MSERKTAEVKFRCTPSFKASLAAAAQAAEKSMSEYLESAVWALENAALGQDLHQTNGLVYDASTGVYQSLRERGLHESGLREFISTNVQETQSQPLTREVLDKALTAACSRSCKPWEFCACKAGE